MWRVRLHDEKYPHKQLLIWERWFDYCKKQHVGKLGKPEWLNLTSNLSCRQSAIITIKPNRPSFTTPWQAEWKKKHIMKVTAYLQCLYCLGPIHLTNLGYCCEQETAGFVGILLHRLQHVVNTDLGKKSAAEWEECLRATLISLPRKASNTLFFPKKKCTSVCVLPDAQWKALQQSANHPAKE